MAAFCKLDKPDKESATLLFFQFLERTSAVYQEFAALRIRVLRL